MAEPSLHASAPPSNGGSRHRVLPAFARALLLSLAAGTGVFILMANESQVPRGALWGGLALLLAVVSLLRALGEFAPRPDDLALATGPLGALAGERPWLAPARALPGAFVLVLVAAWLFGAGALPLAWLLALAWLLPAALRRPLLLMCVLVSLIYLPLLGTFGLWDPWETHYGEVAREILSRDDWISLWWAQDRWFWSKPIFIFWSEALLWSASGIGFAPDSAFKHTEWVLRLPIFALALGALIAVYALVVRRFSARAGVLSCLVLATTPYYGFLTRQAITDMPFVAQMTIAVMLLLLAVHEDPERQVRSYRVGPWSVSMRELALGAFLMLALPQALYLLSRNVTFMGGLFAWHGDGFMYGSAQNGEVSGNFAVRDQRPWLRGLWPQPMVQALMWGAGIAAVLWGMRGERRVRPLLMFGFYLFCGLSFMAKGIPGFALPGLVALLYLVGTGRYELLFSGAFRIAHGALVLLTVSMPWFVAMFVRHGPQFTDRLVVHDHLNRLAKGVHGDKGSIDYFIGQLGYGMFPWIALVPAALGGLALMSSRERTHDPQSARRREILIVLGLWFAGTFTLFSAMATKFHHYIFPALPPLAILIGVLLDDLLGNSGRAQPARSRARVWMLAALAPVPLVLGVAGLWGDVRGLLPDGLTMGERAVWAAQHPWPTPLCALLIVLGLGLLAGAAHVHLRAQPAVRHDSTEAQARVTGAMLLGGAVLCAFVARDLAWTTAEPPAGAERLIHLFVYNYERPFPTDFDYRPILTGFGVVATALLVLAALRAVRPVMLQAFLGTALLFSALCLNVYIPDLTPHWSQQQLIERYYARRKGPQEPLLAWQMNWKGENYYTGNRVHVFVDLDNKKINKWIDDNSGTTAFVLLEHKRLARFKTLVGKREVTPLSSERENNKFVLLKLTI